MGVFGWLGRFVAGLWNFARNSWADVGMGLRPGSGASTLVVFLFLIFFLIGLILVLLGFDLGDVDRWIDARSGWLDAIGTILFRIVCGLVMLVCLAMFWIWFVERWVRFRDHGKDLKPARRSDPEEYRPGCGCLIMAAIVGYLGFIGAFIGP
jgi:hypothetical protein